MIEELQKSKGSSRASPSSRFAKKLNASSSKQSKGELQEALNDWMDKVEQQVNSIED